MTKKVFKPKAASGQKTIQSYSKLLLIYISIVFFTATVAIFNGSINPNTLIWMVVSAAVATAGFLLFRKDYMRYELSVKEYGLLASWLLLSVLFYVWLVQMADNFYSDMEIYTGAGVLISAVIVYSLAFAVLWGDENRVKRRKDTSWQVSFIDAPYYRPSVSLGLAVISFWVLYYGIDALGGVSSGNYPSVARTAGLINVLFASTSLVLSIVSIFKVKRWIKVIFAATALVSLWVVVFQIFGLAFMGGIY